MDVGALDSPGHGSNNSCDIGSTVLIVQIVWGFLLRSLISTSSNVSSSELFEETISIIKICVFFLKTFFL